MINATCSLIFVELSSKPLGVSIQPGVTENAGKFFFKGMEGAVERRLAAHRYSEEGNGKNKGVHFN